MTLTEERSATNLDARHAMIVSQLRTSGVNEPWVLAAMASVAREDFVPAAMRDAAYIDRAIALGEGRFLAAPLVHARMLAEAAPKPTDKALLVGDAQGYLAALLRPLVGSLDCVDPAAVSGLSGQGDYTLVIIDGAVEVLPETLGAQLVEGGRIVTGQVVRGVARLAAGCKAAGGVSLLPLAELGVPPLPEFAAPEALELLSMPALARRAAWLASAALCLAALPAQADTLREALAAAYQTNPSLEAARAQQRAVDESVPIARAAGLPSVSTDATYTEFVKQSAVSFTAPERVLNMGADLGVPLYSGGAVKNRIKAAKLRVEAGQADLRGTESAIFSAIVGAYMDVIRAEAIVGLSRKNVAVLGTNLQATSDRFEIGDLTRTDVAQSQSRLALARSDLRNAEATLANAREAYIRLVGRPPQNLQPPPPLPDLPASAERAVEVALESNPDLVAARERSKAADRDINVASAGRLPRISLFSSGTYNNYLGTLGGVNSNLVTQHDTSAQAGAQISVPLFQGGLPAAQRRQAQAQASAALEQEIATERDVIAQVRSAYTSWVAANDLIRSTQVAVDAAALSLEGVRAENSVGNRTILDILNAEQELLNAQVQLVTARRNAYVAGFSLLAAMGKAEARDLNLDSEILYDPEVNFERVRGKTFDWDNDPAPAARSTRTVDTPVQDGNIPAQ